MDKLIKSLEKDFTDSELLTVLDAALYALANTEMFSEIADNQDITDEEMGQIRDKLKAFMETDKCLPI